MSKLTIMSTTLPETLEKVFLFQNQLRELFYKYVLSFYKQADYLVTVNFVLLMI